jgi:hypothetical protein
MSEKSLENIALIAMLRFLSRKKPGNRATMAQVKS